MRTIIGKNLLEKIDNLFDFSKFSKIAVLTDENIPKSLANKIEKSLNKKLIKIIIPAGEKEKNIETVKIIWEKMFEAGLDRQSLLINLGGGVICDMGGFAASTFMRGIEFVNIPTTLLAQVDASVGGKTGIDFEEIKNAIGVFKKPLTVIIDVITLKTLPKRELVAAFAEIIKHSIIDSQTHFELVTAKRPEDFNQNELLKIIKKSVQLKSKIVEKDFKETTGLRRIVNFGHTVGHAIETLCLRKKISLLHGEAVAIGMVAESKLAHLIGMLSEKDLFSIEKAISNAGLPTKINNLLIKDVLQIMSFDKKNINGEILFSLPERIGKVVPNVKISQTIIKNLLKI